MRIVELLIRKTGSHYNEGPTRTRFISNFELSLQISRSPAQEGRPKNGQVVAGTRNRT